MSTLSQKIYTNSNMAGLYSLARMYFTSGFDENAEKICLGLLSISESNPLPRLLLAAIHLERGNYSLAANHYRIISQDSHYSLQARFGLLACYSGLLDYARSSKLAEELEKEKDTFTEEQNILFDLFKSSLELRKSRTV